MVARDARSDRPPAQTGGTLPGRLADVLEDDVDAGSAVASSRRDHVAARVVHGRVGAELRARSSLSSLEEVTSARAPSAFAIARPAEATPLPIPHQEHPLAGLLVTQGSCSGRRVGAARGSAAASPRRGSRSRRRSATGARHVSSDEKLEQRGKLGADATVEPRHGRRGRGVKEGDDGAGVEVVLEHVGEATWQTSLQSARAGGRIAVCGATTGPNPPAALHRIWWKQLTIYGSTMGAKSDFEGAYELVKSGRAKPVIDSVFPLEQARAAHERLEAGEQFGKIVLAI